MKGKALLIKSIAVSSVVLGGYFINIYNKKTGNLKNRIEALSDYFQLLNHWLEIKNEGKSIVSYFEDMGYHHIAVYGMADLANRLLDDLENSSISVDYGIDRDVCCTTAKIAQIYFPEDKLPETDVIVVTPFFSFESIQSILRKKVSCPIISLEEVIWSI